ncbi:MAG: DUF359 domain-containing protein [Candidatus Nanohaloarchaea archaeon]|nr:DUF359 domain-containing protein [Candidatus Nanohaloarchaea archaeon]
MTRYSHTEDDTSILRGDNGTLYTGNNPSKNAEALLDDIDGDLYIVGDRSAETLLDAGAEPDLIIIDGQTRRDSYTPQIDRDDYQLRSATNPQGTVSDEAWDAVRQGIENGNTLLEIDGEEDLLALPVIMHAGTDSYLAYGDPGIDGKEGIRLLRIDQTIKDEVETLLDG